MTDSEITVVNNNINEMNCESDNLTKDSVGYSNDNISDKLNIVQKQTDESEENNITNSECSSSDLIPKDTNNKVNVVQEENINNISQDRETEGNLENNQKTETVVLESRQIEETQIFDNNLQYEITFNDDNSNEKIKIKVQKKRLAIIDSDSENEDSNKLKIENNFVNKQQDESDKEISTSNDDHLKKRKSRLIKLYDSDSEDDQIENKSNFEDKNDESEKENLTPNDIETQRKKSRINQLYDSESEEEANSNKTKETNEDDEKIFSESYQDMTARLKNLCDSESSEDETNKNTEYHQHEEIPKLKKYNRKSIAKEPKEHKMSGREAAEQMRQIKSESQRMVRESRVHLPYHRPKSHTLQDFLKRRSRINDVIPDSPTVFAIKMSTEQLQITAKKLEEREKEIEMFYKSDSETEENQPAAYNTDKTNDNAETKEQETNLLTDSNKTSETVAEKVDIDKTDNVNSDRLNSDEICDKEPEKMEVGLEENVEYTEKSEEKLEKLNNENELSKDTFDKVEDITENAENLIEKLDENNDKFESNEIRETEDKSNNVEDDEKELRDILEKYIGDKQKPEEVNLSNEIEIETKKKSPNLKMEAKLKKFNPLVKVDFQPRLSGGPNDLVVLDEGIEKSKAVNHLMKRFLIHTAKKVPHKKHEFTILNVDGGNLHQETILIPDEEEDESAKKHQTPGAKMKKLREELEEQIAKKRYEEWKKKEEDRKIDNEEDITYAGEKIDCGLLGDQVLDNEDEDEFTDSESSSEDDDEEEIEIPEKSKPRAKSAFLDDEAEVSEDEDELDENDEEDDEDIEKIDEDDDENDNDEESKEKSFKKPLRRIIGGFENDSDDDDDDHDAEREKIQDKINEIIASEESTANDSNKNTWEENDDDIPLYQNNRLEKTPCKPNTQKQDITAFLTPTLHLTALQGMGSTSKIMQESPGIHLSLSPEPSPLKSHPKLKTKLFENFDHLEGDNNLDELEDLCSGQFTGSVSKESETSKLGGLTQLVSAIVDNASPENINKNLFVSLSSISPINTEKEVKNFDDNSEQIQKEISDLLREDNEANETNNQKEVEEISTRPKYVLATSSDDETPAEEIERKKKLSKKRKRYVIDDISITDEDELNDEIDDEELENEEIEEETRNVDYDSEENEIDMDKLEKEATLKARDFFEDEAELSESEWGSADEDEKDLDDFEIEEGDAEKINEKKVQQELERIHVQQVLDEDKREVRMLQELLLEDGELHGAGRERKFRWKNADSLSWNDGDRPKEDDEDYEENESELQWRKMRYERETFLQEQQSKSNRSVDDDEAFLNDSQFMKLGASALRKSLSGVPTPQNLTLTQTEISESLEVKLPFALASKRGSFLTRSETTLTRLAEITRSSGGSLNGPKNSRNFVFTAIEKTETETTVVGNEKKRKADTATPKILKKLRIADMSPNVQKYKKKLPINKQT